MSSIIELERELKLLKMRWSEISAEIDAKELEFLMAPKNLIAELGKLLKSEEHKFFGETRLEKAALKAAEMFNLTGADAPKHMSGKDRSAHEERILEIKAAIKAAEEDLRVAKDALVVSVGQFREEMKENASRREKIVEELRLLRLEASASKKELNLRKKVERLAEKIRKARRGNHCVATCIASAMQSYDPKEIRMALKMAV